MESAVKSKPQS
jgi:hypothetical protein